MTIKEFKEFRKNEENLKNTFVIASNTEYAYYYSVAIALCFVNEKFTIKHLYYDTDEEDFKETETLESSTGNDIFIIHGNELDRYKDLVEGQKWVRVIYDNQ